MRAFQLLSAAGVGAVVLSIAFLVAVLGPGEGPSSVPTRGPILIEGNEDFTAGNGVRSGTGTPEDPFVIEGWRIVGVGDHRVNIRQTTAHATIRDMELGCSESDGAPTRSIGVLLFHVANVRVERIHASGCTSLLVVRSSDVVLEENFVPPGETGKGTVNVYDSDRISILRNGGSPNDSLPRSGAGIHVIRTSNFTIAGNNVRAWDPLWVGWSSDGVVVDNDFAGGWEALAVHASVNVTIEANRLSLPGGQSSQRVLRITDSRGIRVLGNEIDTKWGRGLQLDSTTEATIVGNTFLHSGITLRGTQREHFASHSIAENTVNGKPVAYVRGCTDFASDGTSVGQLIIVDCDGVRVSNLEFTDTDDAIQVAWSRDVVIRGVRVLANHEYGVYLAFVDNGVVEANAMLDGPFLSRSGPSGTSAGSVEGNVFADVDGGVFILSSTNIRVAYNEISDVVPYSVGIEDRGSKGLMIVGNRLVNAFWAIVLRNSVQATVAGNEVPYAQFGLFLSAVDDVVVEGNGFASSEAGIVLDGLGEDPPSGAVTVLGNEFIQNRFQADDRAAGGHAWDGGYPQGGNFWSDYTGEDRCRGVLQDDCTAGDGLGDEPYLINAENRDRYPLMAPRVRFNFPPQAGLSVSPYHGPESTEFTFDASTSSDIESPLADLEVRWDWESDGAWDTGWSTEKVARYDFDSPGWHVVRAEVRDPGGKSAFTTRWVFVGPLSEDEAADRTFAPAPPWVTPVAAGLGGAAGTLAFVGLLRLAIRRRRKPR